MTTRILLVDDDLNTLAALGYVLQRVGYQVAKATNGEEALEQVALHHPALVVLDIMMPIMNGIEVCKRLRSDPETMHIPVLVLSALGDMRSTTEALMAGANNYMVKPVKPMDFVDQVQALLNNKSSTTATPRPRR